jgi:hypothetical protein
MKIGNSEEKVDDKTDRGSRPVVVKSCVHKKDKTADRRKSVRFGGSEVFEASDLSISRRGAGSLPAGRDGPNPGSEEKIEEKEKKEERKKREKKRKRNRRKGRGGGAHQIAVKKEERVDEKEPSRPQVGSMEGAVEAKGLRGLIDPPALRRLRGEGRGHAEERSVPVAVLPPLLRSEVLYRWDPKLRSRLEQVPPLMQRKKGTQRVIDYTKLQGDEMKQIWPMTRRLEAGERMIETCSLFTRKKVGKAESRLIVDCRNVNVRDPGFERIGPKMPGVGEVARFLEQAKWATVSDFANWFYAFGISREVARLFFVPALRRCVTRLPMGWCRAPDIASAGTAAIADEVGRKEPFYSAEDGGVLICVDNLLVAGPTEATVEKRVAMIQRRVEEVNAKYSQKFGPARQKIRFFGVEWDLEKRRRGLPEEVARRMKKKLLEFASSKGPQSRDVWRRVVGMAGWVAAAVSVDPSRRMRMLQGLRVAEHKRGGVVPGRPVRQEARRLARKATRSVRIDAPAEGNARMFDPETLTRKRDWLVCDAAVPGAIAVVYVSREGARRLVCWKMADDGVSPVEAEFEGIKCAARFIERKGLIRPVVVTDNRSVFGMIRRGVTRGSRYYDGIRYIRDVTDELTMVWVPSARNIADAPSRAVRWREARDSIRIGSHPLGRGSKGSPKPIGYVHHRFGGRS